MTLFTIDISNHDRDRKGSPLDWAAIRRAGIVATCAKASEGDPLAGNYSYTDPWFNENSAGAARAGIPLIGAYHVLSAGTSAGITRQVNWLRESAPAGLSWAMVDVEPFDELKSRSIAPKWADLRDFCAIWTTLTHGRPLGVYLPQWYWSPAIADGGLGKPDLRALPSSCFLVSSDYGPNASAAPSTLYGQRNGDTGRGWAAYGGVVPSLWQYGSQARIPGASSASDVNAYRGTLAELTALLTGKEEDMALTGAQDTALSIAWEVADALRDGQDVTESRKDPVWLVKQVKALATDLAAVKASLATPVDQAKLASDIAAALIASGTNGLTAADHAAVRADVAAVLAGSHIVPA